MKTSIIYILFFFISSLLLTYKVSAQTILKNDSITSSKSKAKLDFKVHTDSLPQNNSAYVDNMLGFAKTFLGTPYFRSDVFIQSIDKRFLDVKSRQWKWEEGADFVPIILPRDFMVMLNTFMSSAGIPQISDQLAKEVQFSLVLSNDNTQRKFNAKIIGFTNEVSSILVPESFMKYGGNTFGTKKDEKITQIILAGKEKEFGLLENFLDQNQYESKNAQLVTGRLKSVVSTLLIVIAFISFLTLLFSSFVLIQYIQLLISKNSYEVKTLLRLGYPSKSLSKVFIVYFVSLFGVLCVLGSLVFVLLKSYLDEKLHSTGIYIDFQYTFYSWATLGFSFVLFFVLTFISSKRNIMHEF